MPFSLFKDSSGKESKGLRAFLATKSLNVISHSMIRNPTRTAVRTRSVDTKSFKSLLKVVVNKHFLFFFKVNLIVASIMIYDRPELIIRKYLYVINQLFKANVIFLSHISRHPQARISEKFTLR